MTGEFGIWSVCDWCVGYGLCHFFGYFGYVVEELVGCCDLFGFVLGVVGIRRYCYFAAVDSGLELHTPVFTDPAH